jgi:hypothetical protein
MHVCNLILTHMYSIFILRSHLSRCSFSGNTVAFPISTPLPLLCHITLRLLPGRRGLRRWSQHAAAFGESRDGGLKHLRQKGPALASGPAVVASPDGAYEVVATWAGDGGGGGRI